MRSAELRIFALSSASALSAVIARDALSAGRPARLSATHDHLLAADRCRCHRWLRSILRFGLASPARTPRSRNQCSRERYRSQQHRTEIAIDRIGHVSRAFLNFLANELCYPLQPRSRYNPANARLKHEFDLVSLLFCEQRNAPRAPPFSGRFFWHRPTRNLMLHAAQPVMLYSSSCRALETGQHAGYETTDPAPLLVPRHADQTARGRTEAVPVPGYEHRSLAHRQTALPPPSPTAAAIARRNCRAATATGDRIVCGYHGWQYDRSGVGRAEFRRLR